MGKKMFQELWEIFVFLVLFQNYIERTSGPDGCEKHHQEWATDLQRGESASRFSGKESTERTTPIHWEGDREWKSVCVPQTFIVQFYAAWETTIVEKRIWGKQLVFAVCWHFDAVWSPQKNKQRRLSPKCFCFTSILWDTEIKCYYFK